MRLTFTATRLSVASYIRVHRTSPPGFPKIAGAEAYMSSTVRSRLLFLALLITYLALTCSCERKLVNNKPHPASPAPTAPGPSKAKPPDTPPPTSAPPEPSGSELPTLAPPPPPPPPAIAGERGREDTFVVDENYAVVHVFYATDRRPTGSAVPARFYGGERASTDDLQLGTLNVSIPRDHRMGAIERPSIWKLEFREDPEKHIVLLNVSPRSAPDFYSELASKVDSSPEKDAFVFVHGFDNTFEEAAWRTAQISYDLGFHGAPILYSWPSKGKLSQYAADEATIDWTSAHLEAFLETVAAQSHATTVHLIAHSMGNRALTRALAAIASRHPVPPMFKEVFLAAPDIDVGVFRQLAATFPTAATHVTLYASSKDKAILASERIHDYDRVGDSTHICVVPNIDTIDATAVDTSLIGHSYYGDNRSILSDMFQVMRTGAPPGQRFGMHVMTAQQVTYWAFVP